MMDLVNEQTQRQATTVGIARNNLIPASPGFPASAPSIHCSAATYPPPCEPSRLPPPAIHEDQASQAEPAQKPGPNKYARALVGSRVPCLKLPAAVFFPKCDQIQVRHACSYAPPCKNVQNRDPRRAALPATCALAQVRQLDCNGQPHRKRELRKKRCPWKSGA